MKVLLTNDLQITKISMFTKKNVCVLQTLYYMLNPLALLTAIPLLTSV